MWLLNHVSQNRLVCLLTEVIAITCEPVSSAALESGESLWDPEGSNKLYVLNTKACNGYLPPSGKNRIHFSSCEFILLAVFSDPLWGHGTEGEACTSRDQNKLCWTPLNRIKQSSKKRCLDKIWKYKHYLNSWLINLMFPPTHCLMAVFSVVYFISIFLLLDNIPDLSIMPGSVLTTFSKFHPQSTCLLNSITSHELLIS